MYPISKYKFYTTPDNKVIAISTYAGKTVKGVAKTDPKDTFDEALGKELAATRCATKVAKKRYARAKKMMKKAMAQYEAASKYVERMKAYQSDAEIEFNEALSKKIKLEIELGARGAN